MTVALAPQPLFSAFNNQGQFLVGGLLYTYAAGTSTPQATYIDSTQTTQNTNPVVLNARGEAFVWLNATLSYKFVLTDSAGNVIWTEDNISGLFAGPVGNLLPAADNTYTLGNASDSFANAYLGPNHAPAYDTSDGNIAYFPRSTAETTAGVVVTSYSVSNSPVYNMARYGLWENILHNGPATTDVNTPIIAAVFAMAKTTGGTIVFPPGDYSFYLDISGQTNAYVTIDAQGSTFRPYSSTPTNSCVVFCDNHTSNVGQNYGSNVVFRNVTFSALKYVPGVATGDVNYCVYMRATNAKFYNSVFTQGAIAGFYGLYVQYIEFWSCAFYNANAAASTAGCLLDSNGLTASTNEAAFYRCVFEVNSIGLWLKGCQKTRINDATVQGNSVAGVQIDADSSGSSAMGNYLRGCWFELNNPGSNIIGNQCVDTTVDACIFWATGGVNQIYFTHVNGVNFINNSWQGGGTPVISLIHPSGNTDTVSLLWRGNVAGTAIQNPTVVTLTHSGLYNVDVHWQGSFTATLTGCTTSPTQTVYWTAEGDSVDMHFSSAGLLGTSNSTSCTVTGIPALIQPLAAQNSIIPMENNSTLAPTVIQIGGGTLTGFWNGSATGFTASGTKGIGGGLARYPLFN